MPSRWRPGCDARIRETTGGATAGLCEASREEAVNTSKLGCKPPNTINHSGLTILWSRAGLGHQGERPRRREVRCVRHVWQIKGELHGPRRRSGRSKLRATLMPAARGLA